MNSDSVRLQKIVAAHEELIQAREFAREFTCKGLPIPTGIQSRIDSCRLKLQCLERPK